jgi:hypothetical protein
MAIKSATVGPAAAETTPESGPVASAAAAEEWSL